ncbi:MAG: iron-sulfur cluster assembly protein [Aigarchaeota archaeon]|nr:iron-sulfur cluster assembly protein [Candidatus Wolframiiraptor gerlachensis]
MINKERVRSKVIAALREAYDPEIPVNVYDLGLVYGVDVDDEGNVEISMTLTAVGCPMAGLIIYRIEEEVRSKVPEAKSVKVKLVWEPMWSPERITPEGREMLKKLYGYDVVEEWIKRYKELRV